MLLCAASWSARFRFDKVTKLVNSEIAADSPGMGGDYESVGETPLGRVERYWKLMSDRVHEGEREVALCYCIEKEKWRPWMMGSVKRQPEGRSS